MQKAFVYPYDIIRACLSRNTHPKIWDKPCMLLEIFYVRCARVIVWLIEERHFEWLVQPGASPPYYVFNLLKVIQIQPRVGQLVLDFAYFDRRHASPQGGSGPIPSTILEELENPVRH